MASSSKKAVTKNVSRSNGAIVGAIVPPKKKIDEFPLMTYLSKNSSLLDYGSDSMDDEEVLKAYNDQRVDELLKDAAKNMKDKMKKEDLTSTSSSERAKALELLHSLEWAKNQEDTWKVTETSRKKHQEETRFLRPLTPKQTVAEEYFSGTQRSKQSKERKRSRSACEVVVFDGKLIPKNNVSHQVPLGFRLTPRPTTPRVPSVGLPFTPGPPISHDDNPWMQKSGSSLFSNDADSDDEMAQAIAESLRTAKLEQQLRDPPAMRSASSFYPKFDDEPAECAMKVSVSVKEIPVEPIKAAMHEMKGYPERKKTGSPQASNSDANNNDKCDRMISKAELDQRPKYKENVNGSQNSSLSTEKMSLHMLPDLSLCDNDGKKSFYNSNDSSGNCNSVNYCNSKSETSKIENNKHTKQSSCNDYQRVSERQQGVLDSAIPSPDTELKDSNCNFENKIPDQGRINRTSHVPETFSVIPSFMKSGAKSLQKSAAQPTQPKDQFGACKSFTENSVSISSSSAATKYAQSQKVSLNQNSGTTSSDMIVQSTEKTTTHVYPHNKTSSNEDIEESVPETDMHKLSESSVSALVSAMKAFTNSSEGSEAKAIPPKNATSFTPENQTFDENLHTGIHLSKNGSQGNQRDSRSVSQDVRDLPSVSDDVPVCNARESFDTKGLQQAPVSVQNSNVHQPKQQMQPSSMSQLKENTSGPVPYESDMPVSVQQVGVPSATVQQKMTASGQLPSYPSVTVTSVPKSVPVSIHQPQASSVTTAGSLIGAQQPQETLGPSLTTAPASVSQPSIPPSASLPFVNPQGFGAPSGASVIQPDASNLLASQIQLYQMMLMQQALACTPPTLQNDQSRTCVNNTPDVNNPQAHSENSSVLPGYTGAFGNPMASLSALSNAYGMGMQGFPNFYSNMLSKTQPSLPNPLATGFGLGNNLSRDPFTMQNTAGYPGMFGPGMLPSSYPNGAPSFPSNIPGATGPISAPNLMPNAATVSLNPSPMNVQVPSHLENGFNRTNSMMGSISQPSIDSLMIGRGRGSVPVPPGQQSIPQHLHLNASASHLLPPINVLGLQNAGFNSSSNNSMQSLPEPGTIPLITGRGRGRLGRTPINLA